MTNFLFFKWQLIITLLEINQRLQRIILIINPRLSQRKPSPNQVQLYSIRFPLMQTPNEPNFIASYLNIPNGKWRGGENKTNLSATKRRTRNYLLSLFLSYSELQFVFNAKVPYALDKSKSTSWIYFAGLYYYRRKMVPIPFWILDWSRSAIISFGLKLKCVFSTEFIRFVRCVCVFFVITDEAERFRKTAES